jgi:hypothetical protein
MVPLVNVRLDNNVSTISSVRILQLCVIRPLLPTSYALAVKGNISAQMEAVGAVHQTRHALPASSPKVRLSASKAASLHLHAHANKGSTFALTVPRVSVLQISSASQVLLTRAFIPFAARVVLLQLRAFVTRESIIAQMVHQVNVQLVSSASMTSLARMQ